MSSSRVALVIGHSFVSRLRVFVRDFKHHSLGLKRDFVVFTYGIPGIKLDKFNHELSHMVSHISPEIVIIQMGSNDLSHSSPEQVSSKLIDSAHICLSLGVKKVFINQLFPRKLSKIKSTHHTPVDFNTRINKTNQLLSSLSDQIHFYFWRHRTMSNWTRLIGNDGVHLSHQGLCKYYRSVRGAILNGFNCTHLS